jgi:hypothetical protein
VQGRERSGDVGLGVPPRLQGFRNGTVYFLYASWNRAGARNSLLSH